MTANQWRKTGAGVGIALLLSSVGFHAAQAGTDPTPPPPIAVSPTTVADGTPFTVSGAGCLDPETQSAEGYTAVIEAPRLAYPNSDNPEGKILRDTDVNPDGTWSITVAPDTREDFFGPYEDFDTTVTAYCTDTYLEGGYLFQYGVVVMHYDGTRVDATTTAPATSTPAPPGPADPAPATPVASEPTFTG